MNVNFLFPRRNGTTMKARQWIIVAALSLLFVLAIVGVIVTSAPAPLAGRPGNASDETQVDQRPLRTARKLAALALTPEEQRIAQEVLRISDHEVDLAFAGALRDAAQHPPKPTPETREISARLAKTQAAASADQVLVAQLSKQVSAAKEQDRENLQQQLDLAKAQLELDGDEVNDAKADLARAGGDTRDKIQRLLDQHEASQHEGDTVRPQAAAADANYLPENLIGRVRAWNALRQKHAQLLQARQDALGAATSLTHSHDALEKKIQDEKLGKPALSQPAAGPLTSPDQDRTDSREATAAAVSSLRQLSNDQKNLADIDKLIHLNPPTFIRGGRLWTTTTRGAPPTTCLNRCCGLFSSSCWFTLPDA